MIRARSMLALVGTGLMLGACSSHYQADARVLGLVSRAEFGRAREVLYTQTPPTGKLTDLLDATKKGMLALADGLPDAAESDFEVVFDTLRTQGLNADRTTESIFVNEQGTRIWKGEPFEQAMAYMAIAEADASRGDWGNARASAENALFHLRDYSATSGDDIRYTSVESTFALGYLIHGVAALEMQRREEAEESLAKAAASRPELGPLTRTLLDGAYDTILVIDYGLGPRREAVGDGGVGVAYFPRTQSDDAEARVEAGGRGWGYPLACDVNAMSRDERWQSLESIRRFKQGLGQAMMLGGAVLASTGGTRGDDDVARLAAGVGLLALGAIAQANSQADTRHNELLPQRVYVAAFDLDGWQGPVRVAIDGHPGGRMTLHGLASRARRARVPVCAPARRERVVGGCTGDLVRQRCLRAARDADAALGAWRPGCPLSHAPGCAGL
ncbi:MAG: hypothetical protein IPJ41_06280 [Phycisphaerales bacterium]|nr:hypothetical protein [Phycisphaerales bacterium]